MRPAGPRRSSLIRGEKKVAIGKRLKGGSIHASSSLCLCFSYFPLRWRGKYYSVGRICCCIGLRLPQTSWVLPPRSPSNSYAPAREVAVSLVPWCWCGTHHTRQPSQRPRPTCAAASSRRVQFSCDSVWQYFFVCICLNLGRANVFKEYSIYKER